MIDIRLVGRSSSCELDLSLAQVSDLASWPSRLDLPVKPFVVFTPIDARRVTDTQLRIFAKKLLGEGCLYAYSWGPESGRVEHAFDLAFVDAELAGTPYADTLGTTSHAGESLDEALWFALFIAHPPSDVPSAVLVVSDRAWMREIEAKLADCDQWSADLRRADEEGRT